MPGRSVDLGDKVDEIEGSMEDEVIGTCVCRLESVTGCHENLG